MTPITLLPDVLAVLPPEDSFEFEMNFTKDKLVCWAADGHYDIELPPGAYEIICYTKYCTEEQAAQVVEKDYFDGIGYQYANYELERVWTFGKRKNTALESLSSLLKAKGLVGANYLLIRKLK